MPKYTFECSCGLEFSRVLKMGSHPSHECPSCQAEAQRKFEGFGFDFAHGGKTPSNSGVTKHDYPSADQAVGRDAENRWIQHAARDRVKNKVREVGGTRALVRTTGTDYVEYQAGGASVVETRKKMVKELRDVMDRAEK